MSDRKPTGIDPIANAVDAARTDIRTIVPAQIVTYNPATQRANVQPAIKCRFADGTVLPLAQVTEAPVAWPRGGGWAIHWTLAPGDTVALLVADRAIDRWLTQGGIVDPQDRRRHHITDAIVFPGLNTDLDPNPLGATALVDGLTIGREDGTATIKIGAAGNVEIDAATSIKLGSAAAALGVARATDPTLLNAADVALLTGLAAAWAAVQPAGGPLVAPGATPLPAGAGLGTITAGSAKVTAD